MTKVKQTTTISVNQPKKLTKNAIRHEAPTKTNKNVEIEEDLVEMEDCSETQTLAGAKSNDYNSHHF